MSKPKPFIEAAQTRNHGPKGASTCQRAKSQTIPSLNRNDERIRHSCGEWFDFFVNPFLTTRVVATAVKSHQSASGDEIGLMSAEDEGTARVGPERRKPREWDVLSQAGQGP